MRFLVFMSLFVFNIDCCWASLESTLLDKEKDILKKAVKKIKSDDILGVEKDRETSPSLRIMGGRFIHKKDLIRPRLTSGEPRQNDTVFQGGNPVKAVPLLSLSALLDDTTLDKTNPLRRRSRDESNDLVVVQNPFYGKRLPLYGDELDLVKADPTDPLFRDSTRSHGLNLGKIHKRCLLLRVGGGIKENNFSELVHMVRGTITTLSHKELLLMKLKKKKKPSKNNLLEIDELETYISIYKGVIQRSFETISQAMGISVEQLENLSGSNLAIKKQ